jgi:peroxin-19
VTATRLQSHPRSSLTHAPDVLDQFSANAPATSSAHTQSQPQPTAQPLKDPTPATTTQPPVPDGPRPGESEEAFIARLTSELSSAMSQLADDSPDDVRKASPEELAKMGKEIEAFTLAMEKEGIQPEDLLKAILGEKEGGEIAAAAHKEADSRNASPEQSKSRPTSPETKAKSPPPAAQDGQGSSTASFEDTIRRTMARMESSSAAATSASTASATSEEDMLAELLKTLGTSDSSNPSDPDELSSLFLKMMQELTKKDVLYEPMRDLNAKYPDYLRENRGKLKREDAERYEKQVVVVREIVSEFEGRGYSDEDEGCRERIWEKMQTMQELGAPPEELVQGPMPGMGMPGVGEGCPTQ